MANRHWVGGTATWDGTAGTKWATTSGGAGGAAVPTSSDDVFFDGASGAVTVTTSGTATDVCNNLDFTGFTGTFSIASNTYVNVYGNLTLVSGMTLSGTNVGSRWQFLATATGKTITTGGKSMLKCVFDGVGGGWTWQDNITCTNQAGSGYSFDIVNGAVDFNGKTITGTTNGGGIYSSYSNVRSITFGAATVNLAGTFLWNITDTTNLTWSAASATFTSTAASTYIFSGGGLSYPATSFTGTLNACALNGANTFASLTLSGGANTTPVVSLGANQTVTGTFTSNGNSVINRMYINSSAKGTARTITAATVTCTNLDLQDITGAGAGSWDLSAITGGSGNCGGNTSITFTTPATQYWVPSGGTSTGTMSVTTRWANASGGTAGTGRSPLPQDTARIDANSIDAGSRTITNDKPRIGSVDFTGATNTPAWALGTSAASYFGSITLIAGMTLTGASATATYEGRSSSTITTGGLTWLKPLAIDCVNSVGTLTQGDNFASSSTFTATSGTFNSSTFTTDFTTVTCTLGTITIGAGGLDCTTLTKSGAGGAITIGGTSTASGAINLSGSGTVTINGNLTGSSTFQTTGCTLTGSNATLSFSGGSIVFPASGGGSTACNPIGGFIS